MTVTPSQFRLLANALSFAQTNHQVIGQNIANVNTPNYQAQEVSFDAFPGTGPFGNGVAGALR